MAEFGGAELSRRSPWTDLIANRPGAPFVLCLDANARGSDTVWNIGLAFRKHVLNEGFTPGIRNNLRTTTKRVLEAVGRSQDFYTWTVRQIWELTEGFKGKAQAQRLRSTISHLYRWKLGIEIESKDFALTAPNRRIPNIMEIQDAEAHHLVDFFEPSYFSGRFGDILLVLKEAVITCPKDRFRIVQPGRGLRRDNVERQAFMMAAKRMLKAYAPDFRIRWSKGKQAFYVAHIDLLRSVANDEDESASEFAPA